MSVSWSPRELYDHLIIMLFHSASVVEYTDFISGEG